MSENIVREITKKHIGLKVRRVTWMPEIYSLVTAVGESKFLGLVYRYGKRCGEQSNKKLDAWEILA